MIDLRTQWPSVSGEPVPVFGERRADAACIDRPGAYGVLWTAGGRLPIVRTPRGGYLPGGGADPGETPLETLAREVREEFGGTIGELMPLCASDEYIHPPYASYLLRCVFFMGRIVLDGAPTEHHDGHENLLVTVTEAADMLSRLGQLDALKRAVRQAKQ